MSSTVITSEGITFTIPSDYYQKSEYFRSMEDYQNRSDIEISQSNDVEFTVEELNLLTVPVNELNQNQVLQVYPVDRFFLHVERINQLEVAITRYWWNDFYHNMENVVNRDVKHLVTSIVFSNIKCASHVINRSDEFDHNDLIRDDPTIEYWSVRDHILFWNNVRRELINYVEPDSSLILSNYYSFEQYFKLVEQSNGKIPSHVNGYLHMNVIYYYRLINGISDYRRSILLHQLMKYIRYQDLGNSLLDHVYLSAIGRCNPGGQPYSYYQTIARFSELRESTTIDNYPYSILENNDGRVIKELIIILAHRGVIPLNLKNFNLILPSISPAAVELLRLNHKLIADKTERLDTFLSLKNVRITQTKECYLKIAWHCIINGLDVVDDVEGYINMAIKNIELLNQLLEKPDRVSLIPCVKLMEYSARYAHVIAELGGRIALSDHDPKIPLSMSVIDLMLTYDYQLNDIDKLLIEPLSQLNGQDSLVIKKLCQLYQMDIIVKPEVDKTINKVEFLPMNEWLKLKPEALNDLTWNTIIYHTNTYRSGSITLDELLTQIEKLMVASRDLTLEMRGLIIDAIINYLRIYSIDVVVESQLLELSAKLRGIPLRPNPYQQLLDRMIMGDDGNPMPEMNVERIREMTEDILRIQ